MTIKRINRLDWLPFDGDKGTLIGRAWVPGAISGPVVAVIHDDEVFDLSEDVWTMSELFEADDPVSLVRKASGTCIGTVSDLIANTASEQRDVGRPWFLSACDLQVIKAAGVTFASSLLERVIEEQARGDIHRAAAIRKDVLAALGGDYLNIKPGSPESAELKSVLVKRGLWSQYLEVGIGPDAELFTKSAILSSVGPGAQVGVHRASEWNNPEPEIVLAVNSRGSIVGATLGNDVNLRDVEGRSALLLGKAKDNNASCAIGPFVRLFDETFSLDDVRNSTIRLLVEGDDEFSMEGHSSMNQISRDPVDLVSQAIGPSHQYPDGFMLFLGTMFAPSQDRGKAGSGFTHRLGDAVEISTPKLGRLINTVNYCDEITPWTFGLRDFISYTIRRRARK